jgi:hypothetical protein
MRPCGSKRLLFRTQGGEIGLLFPAAISQRAKARSLLCGKVAFAGHLVERETKELRLLPALVSGGMSLFRIPAARA